MTAAANKPDSGAWSWSHEVSPNEAGAAASDVVASATGLSKSKVKQAMEKGAVWLDRGGSRRRLRRARTALKTRDRLALYYDPALLERAAPTARCLAEEGRYSLWYKPAGLMAQGTDYADPCSVLRKV